MGNTGEVIILPYSPRKIFLPLHNRAERFAAVVAHRRAGKTVAEINDKIRTALTLDLPNPRCAYLAPYYRQAKAIAWQYLKDYSRPIPGVQINESELRVDFPNGGQVRLYGADNPDALRGIYLDDVTLDEPADMSPRLWPEVIRPALVDRRGRGCFIGTPKGKNEFYDMFRHAQGDKDWLALMLKASETGVIPQDELQDAQRTMSPDQYAQEFECSFDAAVIGAIYAQQMTQAHDEGRITTVPYDSGSEVFTAWDLGWADCTAIWFLQFVGRELRWIDFYESAGEPLKHYADLVKSKPYSYMRLGHFLPHDAGHENIRGASVSRQLTQLGIDNRVLEREIEILPGIELTRQTIGYSVFDAAKCAQGIKALEQYSYARDETKNIQKASPKHDWTSHAADGARYASRAAALVKSGIAAKPRQVSFSIEGRMSAPL